MRSLALLVPTAVLFTACGMASVTTFDEGVRLYREGSYAAARDAFDAAVRENPRSATYFNNRGVAKARLGDFDGAAADYTQAMQITPTDPEIVFNRGNAYAAAGNLAAAINDFTTAVTLSPGYAHAYFNRGTVRSVLGDVSGAVSDWQWAADIERDPWTKAAIRRRVGIDHAHALPRQVIVNPSATINVAPPTSEPAPALDVRAFVARAMAREVEGDRAGALADLRAAVMMETDAARRERIDRLLRNLEASQ